MEGSSDWTIYFMYNIRWKGYYEQDWHEIYSPSNGFLPRDNGSETVYSNQGEYSSDDGLKLTTQGMYVTLPPVAKVDFQVEAMIGYTHRVVEGGMAPWYFFGETSGWSSTQTLTVTDTVSTIIPSASPFPSISQNASPTPTGTHTSVPAGLDWVRDLSVIILVAVVVLLVFVVVFLRRRTTAAAPH